MLRSGERNVKSLQPGTMLLPFGPPDHSTFLFRMPRENHHQDPVIFWWSSRLYPLTLWLQTANFAKNRCRPCDWKRELSSTSRLRFLRFPAYSRELPANYRILVVAIRSSWKEKRRDQPGFYKTPPGMKDCHCKLRITLKHLRWHGISELSAWYKCLI